MKECQKCYKLFESSQSWLSYNVKYCDSCYVQKQTSRYFLPEKQSKLPKSVKDIKQCQGCPDKFYGGGTAKWCELHKFDPNRFELQKKRQQIINP